MFTLIRIYDNSDCNAPSECDAIMFTPTPTDTVRVWRSHNNSTREYPVVQAREIYRRALSDGFSL